MAEIAPNLVKTVTKRTAKRRMVAQAIQNRRWVGDIKGALTIEVLIEYFHIWKLWTGYSCSRMCRTVTLGNYPRMGHTATNLHMEPSSWEPSSWDHGEGFGKLGHPRAVNSSFGWYFTIGSGRPTGWLKEVSPIHMLVPFVIRLRKPYITCWLNVYSLAKCGP